MPLELLPDRQREAIELRYSEVPEKETARRMEISERRVRYLTAAARRNLGKLGFTVKPLPVGRPRSQTSSGTQIDFDGI